MKKVTRTIPTVIVKIKGKEPPAVYPSTTVDSIRTILESTGVEIESIAESDDVYECTEKEFLAIAKRKASK